MHDIEGSYPIISCDPTTDDGGVFCTMIFCGSERVAILKCMRRFLCWIRRCGMKREGRR